MPQPNSGRKTPGPQLFPPGALSNVHALPKVALRFRAETRELIPGPLPEGRGWETAGYQRTLLCPGVGADRKKALGLRPQN